MYDARQLRQAMAGRLIIAHLGRPFSAFRHARILLAYRRAHELLRQQQSALSTGDEQLHLCCSLTGEAAYDVQRCITEFFDQAPLPLLARYMRRGLVDFLEIARRSGIRLGVLSDYPAREKLKAMGVLEYFDVVACTQDEHIRRLKPDPAGLNYILAALQTPASRALYIGDRPEVDVKSARAAGVPAVIVGPHAGDSGSGWVPVRDFSELIQHLS